MNELEIRLDDLTGREIAGLLQAHLDNMKAITPPESVHALDLTALRSPEITFWSAWQDSELLGCAALKEIDKTQGEIKSMRTAQAHRRQGVAARLLEHIIQEAKRREYSYLKLETGAMFEFAPARALYERYGFDHTHPFGEYVNDPNSVFMAKQLQP